VKIGCRMVIRRNMTGRILFDFISDGVIICIIRKRELRRVNPTSVLLAGMSPSSEGGEGTSSSEVVGSEEREVASQPIGSLADYQIPTPSFRHRGTQGWE
jgi:hypothetical protein